MRAAAVRTGFVDTTSTNELTQAAPGGIVKSDELEIGRILHLKSEIKNLKLDKPKGGVIGPSICRFPTDCPI
jgi:hypothetical protein